MEKIKHIQIDDNDVKLSLEEVTDGCFLRIESKDSNRKIAKFFSKEDVELYKDFLTEMAKSLLK